MRRLTYGILLLSTIWAQRRDPDPRQPIYRQPVLKFYPLALIDPFQYTLHMGVEFPVSGSSSLQAEGGWVFGYLGDNEPFGTTESDFAQTGFKARLQWREFFSLSVPKNGPAYTLTGGYFSLMGGFQYYHQNLGYIDTSYVYPPPSPPPLPVPYERTVQAFSLGFLIGYQAQLGGRFAIDFYTGLGVRYSQHRWQPLAPPYRNYTFTPVGDLILRRGGRPVPYMGFSFGWILR